VREENPEMNSRRSKVLTVGGVVAVGLLVAAVWIWGGADPGGRESAPVASLPTAPIHEAEAESPTEQPSTLELSLRLIGTTSAEDPRRRRAVIIDFNHRRRQVTRIGDRLLGYDAVFVREIEPRRARLDVEGEPRWLTLDLETPVEQEAFQMPVEWWSELADKDSEELTKDEQQDLFVEGITKMWRMRLGRRELGIQPVQGRFAPWEEDGEFVGLFASHIEPGGLFDQLGFEPRDIIHDVNGVKVKSPEDTLEWMERFAHDREIRIHITRDGEPVTIESHLAPQILDEDLDMPEPS
jgi:type II secretory pathway component PulC